MKKQLFTIMLAFLAMSANAQNMAQDSTALGGMNPSMNTQQAKAQTINSSSYGAGPLTSATPTSVTTYNYATCPSGFTYNGSSTYPVSQQTTTTYVQNGQVVGTTTSAPQDTGIDCTSTQTQTLSCDPGYTGSIQQYRSVAASEGDYQYGPWVTSSNTCKPIPPVVTTDYQSLSCGAGYTGSIYQSRTKSTAWNGVVTYGAWNTYSSTCAAIPPTVTTEYQNLSCGAGYVGSISQQRTKTTAWDGSVNYGNWITTGNSCTVAVTYNYTTEYQTLSCSAGQVGNIYQQRTRTNGSDGSVSYTGWSTYSNTCTTPAAPVGCDWEFGTAAIGTISNPCHIGYAGASYPSGQRYTCKANGWVMTSAGSGTVRMYCD